MASTLKHSLSRIRNREGRSPIKRKALRFPGQSVDEKIQGLVSEEADSYIVTGLLMLGVATFEWLHVLMDMPPSPKLITTIAIPIVFYCAFRLFQVARRVHRLKLGRDGERAVGQYLDDKLRPLGFFVLHDISAGNWNIDHVIVGEQGIYTVETKTRSKPMRGRPVVRYDGESVTVGGFKPDRDPVKQAKSQATWLSETLSRSLGVKLPVQPVVVFPGWFVESPKITPGVWVLEPKQLPAFVLNSRQSIDSSTASTVSHFLRQMVRAA